MGVYNHDYSSMSVNSLLSVFSSLPTQMNSSYSTLGIKLYLANVQGKNPDSLVGSTEKFGMATET